MTSTAFNTDERNDAGASKGSGVAFRNGGQMRMHPAIMPKSSRTGKELIEDWPGTPGGSGVRGLHLFLADVAPNQSIDAVTPSVDGADGVGYFSATALCQDLAASAHCFVSVYC